MGWDNFVVAADNHGDMQDLEAVGKFQNFLGLWKPSIRVHAGDNFDLRAIRRGAGEEEKREAMKADFDAGTEFVKMMRPTHFLRGNHDERLWDLAKAKRGFTSDYAEERISEFEKLLRKLRCKMLPYDKRAGVLEIGKLRVIHGYAHGVNAARRSAQAYGSVLLGHAHSIQSSSIEGLDNRVGRIIGCLCRLNMEYSRATMASLVHRHGFAYGVIHSKTGLYQVWQAESINGKWLLPSDIKEI